MLETERIGTCENCNNKNVITDIWDYKNGTKERLCLVCMPFRTNKQSMLENQGIYRCDNCRIKGVTTDVWDFKDGTKERLCSSCMPLDRINYLKEVYDVEQITNEKSETGETKMMDEVRNELIDEGKKAIKKPQPEAPYIKDNYKPKYEYEIEIKRNNRGIEEFRPLRKTLPSPSKWNPIGKVFTSFEGAMLYAIMDYKAHYEEWLDSNCETVSASLWFHQNECVASNGVTLPIGPT